MTIAQDMIAQLAGVLASQGIPGVFYRQGVQQSGGTGTPLRFLKRHAGLRDEAVVNTYGINAQIITLAHSPEFEAREPEQFDAVVQALDAAKPIPFVFDAVVRREVAGVVIAWTAFIRGDAP
jgi:hypothetical protein